MDTGGAGDRTCDVPIAVAMEIAMETGMEVTPIASDTAITVTLEQTESNENGKRSNRSEAPAAALGPWDWKSRME